MRAVLAAACAIDGLIWIPADTKLPFRKVEASRTEILSLRPDAGCMHCKPMPSSTRSNGEELVEFSESARTDTVGWQKQDISGGRRGRVIIEAEKGSVDTRTPSPIESNVRGCQS